MATSTSRRLPHLAALLALVVLLAAAGPAAPARAAIGGPEPLPPCMKTVDAEIALLGIQYGVHNAKPNTFVLPDQAAQSAAYDAEAAALNARKAILLRAVEQCVADAVADALAKLARSEELDAARQARIEAAQAQLRGSGAQPLVVGGVFVVPTTSPLRPLHDALLDGATKGTPGSALCKAPMPKPSDPDPAFRGATIGAPHCDRVVPVAQLLALKGFTGLTPSQQWTVVTAPSNYQWVSARANAAKQSGSVRLVTGTDPQWVVAQDTRRTRQVQVLQRVIAVDRLINTILR